MLTGKKTSLLYILYLILARREFEKHHVVCVMVHDVAGGADYRLWNLIGWLTLGMIWMNWNFNDLNEITLLAVNSK